MAGFYPIRIQLCLFEPGVNALLNHVFEGFSLAGPVAGKVGLIAAENVDVCHMVALLLLGSNCSKFSNA